MPPIKFERIVSCSSEDPAFPAENLLKRDRSRKWKCKERGEKTASVVIQLEKPCVINKIDIGNESASFIEVLVSKSTAPDDFKVLLVMSSFMTPMDARSETNTNKVRFFSSNDLSESVREEKWDRIKVVCTQPFTKHLQYGLSFIVLNESDTQADGVQLVEKTSDKTLGRFNLKDEDDESNISVGSFFSRRRDFVEAAPPPPPSLTGAAAIREASSSADRAKHKTPSRRKNSHDSNESPVAGKKKKLNQEIKNKEQKEATHTNNKIGERIAGPSSESLRNDDPQSSRNASSSALPRKTATNSSSSHSKDLKTKPNISYKPFNKLLEDVEIVISGYVNPGRADIRTQAMQMGAKYSPDWGRTSTHLICAFANTPKFQQVKGKGVIVTRDWIDECYGQRKKLHWRRFAVDNAEKSASLDESEPEIWELTSEAGQGVNLSTDTPPMNRRNNLAMQDTRLDHSSSDSEDEVARIKAQQQLKQKRQSTDKHRKPQHKTEQKDIARKSQDEYACSTDVDSDEEARKREKEWMIKQHEVMTPDELPPLPNFFHDKTFVFSPDLSEKEQGELYRYIIAFGGKVQESLNQPTDYVLAHKKKDDTMQSSTAGCVSYVTPDWIWECNDQQGLVPTNRYELH